MPSNRLEKLAAFRELLGEELGWEFDVEEFDDRFRMQKYVFLADAFGFEHEYDYNIHLHGPYSPPLAEDYYEDGLDEMTPSASGLNSFDHDEFVELVEDREKEWLEVAATIKSLHRRYSTPPGAMDPEEDVIRRTLDLKDVSEERAREIYETLESRDVL